MIDELNNSFLQVLIISALEEFRNEKSFILNIINNKEKQSFTLSIINIIKSFT